jgi:hypothetical protein
VSESNRVGALYNTKLSEVKSLRAEINTAETPIYRDLLTQLQHTNPQQVSVIFSGNFPANVKAQMTEFIRLTYGTAESNGSTEKIIVLTVPKIEREYHNSGMVFLTPSTTTSTTIHETLHAMQYQFGTGQSESAQFATDRTAGESLQKLSKLVPSGTYDKSEVAYRDAVDNPYTLKLYAGSKIRDGSSYEFMEVLPMALSNISAVRQNTDRGLLELGMQILKGGRSR